MQSILQILKINDPKTGVSKKTGNPYDMQDCECLLINDDGSVGSVGVLQVPKSLRDVVKVGTFTASFALQAGFQDRRIGAVLTGLIPLNKPAAKAV